MSEAIQHTERKDIPARREEIQSAALTWIVFPLLLLCALSPPVHAILSGSSLAMWSIPLLLSLGFAALVWILKAATLPASGIGFMVCMIVSQPLAAREATLLQTALLPLAALFLLTFAATRFGRSRKESRNLAERRRGRRASQIVANLGVAALCCSLEREWGWKWHAGCIAALAEAAADTVSSEIGQAAVGHIWLVTSWQRVAAGTDGGVSVAGSTAGIIAAGTVVAVAHLAPWPDAILVFIAACAGLFFDSFLGATVERRGWLGNDLVNFYSTVFAAGIALVWLSLRGGL